MCFLICNVYPLYQHFYQRDSNLAYFYVVYPPLCLLLSQLPNLKPNHIKYRCTNLSEQCLLYPSFHQSRKVLRAAVVETTTNNRRRNGLGCVDKFLESGNTLRDVWLVYELSSLKNTAVTL